MPVKTKNGKVIKVITINEPTDITPNEREMDIRAKEAVKAAINKAIVCKKPIAKYDKVRRKSYIEYPDGRKKYAR